MRPALCRTRSQVLGDAMPIFVANVLENYSGSHLYTKVFATQDLANQFKTKFEADNTHAYVLVVEDTILTTLED